MVIDYEINLTPEQKSREQEVFSNFSDLVETERSRYEDQAIQLIQLKTLETELEGFKLTYLVKEDSYLCKLHNQEKLGESYEIEFPIPSTEQEKLETLIELFAQCEAGKIR
jgi:hypothetical protein